MRFLLRLFLSLIVILPIALGAIIYSAIDTFPRINRAADITPASIERAKRILDQNDPRKMKAGVRQTVSVGENDLDHAANYLARQYAAGGARVEFEAGAAHVAASLRIARVPVNIYTNLEAHLAESGSLARVKSLHIGRLSISGPLAQWMIPRLLATVIEEDDLRSFRRAIKSVSISNDRVTLVYEWQADLPDKLRTVLVPEEERERLRIYHERLVAVSKSLKGPNISLTELLVPLFILAERRSIGSNPVAENRAAILPLAIYVNGHDLSGIVPTAKNWPTTQRLEVLLNGRDDFPKHFIISAALAAKAGGPLSDAVGLYKELADAREGSGFSFNDIAADRAGTRFGEYAADFESAAKLQRRLSAGVHETDLMPMTEDLPEFMPEREFIRRFGGVDTPAYNKMIGEIERRIAALQLYR